MKYSTKKNKKRQAKEKQDNVNNNPENQNNETNELNDDFQPEEEILHTSKVVEEIVKPSPKVEEKVIDDDLKIDNWEDMLDDETVEKQVNLQVEEGTAKIVEEYTADTTAINEKNDSLKDSYEEEKIIKKEKAYNKAKPNKNDEGATGAGSIFERGNAKRKEKAHNKNEKVATKVEIKGNQEERTFRCPIV